jgi:hypothetical protein
MDGTMKAIVVWVVLTAVAIAGFWFGWQMGINRTPATTYDAEETRLEVAWTPGFTIDFTVCSGPYGQQPCLGKQLSTDAQSQAQCEGVAQTQLAKWRSDDPRNERWWIARFSCKAPAQHQIGI